MKLFKRWISASERECDVVPRMVPSQFNFAKLMYYRGAMAMLECIKDSAKRANSKTQFFDTVDSCTSEIEAFEKVYQSMTEGETNEVPGN